MHLERHMRHAKSPDRAPTTAKHGPRHGQACQWVRDRNPEVPPSRPSADFRLWVANVAALCVSTPEPRGQDERIARIVSMGLIAGLQCVLTEVSPRN